MRAKLIISNYKPAAPLHCHLWLIPQTGEWYQWRDGAWHHLDPRVRK